MLYEVITNKAEVVEIIKKLRPTGGTSSDSRDTTAGHALLSWVAPTTRSDGSYLPITDLQGYRIYYGTSANDLSVLVDLNDDSITEFDVNSLPSGNYYFAVSASYNFV